VESGLKAGGGIIRFDHAPQKHRRLYEAGSTGGLAHSSWDRRRSTAGQTMINPANAQRPALKAVAGTVLRREVKWSRGTAKLASCRPNVAIA
jgi:hypothetical protein